VISVVIPAFNAEGTIRATIESVLNQTYSDLEVIVIDDGSFDGTLAIARNVDDPRLKVFSYDNGGVCLARNRGISHAAGELISFIDADDLWTSDKLEAQAKAAKQAEEVVAYSWTSYLYDHDGRLIPGARNRFEGDVYGELLKKNFVASGSNILTRTELIRRTGSFDQTLPQCADWDLCLRLAAQCKFVLVPKHQVLYRQSASSMTSRQIDQMEKQCLSMLERAYRSAPAEYRKFNSRSVAWVYQYCTERYLQTGERVENVKSASRTLCKAFTSRPLSLFERYSIRLLFFLLKRWCLAIGRPNQISATGRA
jgi:glycosyltransferase involved in cell wall biosynthesis